MQTSLKVLLVDDDISQQIYLKQSFKHIQELQVHLDWKPNYEEGMELILQNQHDVYLIDFYLDDVQGTEVIKEALSQGCEAPMILLTASEDRETDLQAMASGATDCLVKSELTPKLLERSIRYAISQKKTENQLKHINKKLRQFTGIVAHDLRNPIGTIRTFCEVLKSSPEMLQECLPRIEQSANIATELIRDILDLTALETGQLQITIQPTPLKKLIRDAIGETHFQADKKQVQIHNEVETGDDHIVNVDPKRLLQVCCNLLSNAIKFTPAHGKVSIHAIADAQGVEIQITDTGVGIPEEKIPKLFSKGERISTLGTDGEKGTGFGLALIQEILLAHSSQLCVKSELGKGSCFYFQIGL